MWTIRKRRDRSVDGLATRSGRRLGSRAAAVSAALLIGAMMQACTGGSSSPGSNGNSNIGANSNPSQTAFRVGALNWASSIANNPYAATPTPDIAGYTLLTLAAISTWDRPGPNPYYPEIAESWTLGKHVVTFHLRPSAKWQDGKPLTSKDVVTSLLVAGADYNPVWAGITSIETPDEHTVTVNLQDWVVPQNALERMLKVVIVSDSQFGQFVAKSGFDATLKSYWKTYNILHPTAGSIAKAAATPAGKALAAASGKLTKFNPKNLNGNGPYTLKSANVSGILYQKWDGFWDAKKITAPYIQLYPMSSATEYGAIIGGTIDEEFDSQYNSPQVARMRATGTAHYGVIPSPVQQLSLIFNFSHYPFNLLAVRQAFAHIIDRKDLVRRGSGGTVVQNSTPVETPDGINFAHAEQYLTKAQFAKLNHYPHDLDKAASLLQGAGFTKKDGKWYTPKGDPFKFTLTEPASYAQFTEDGQIIAGYLKDFGIDVQVEQVDQGTWSVKSQSGDYAVTQNFMDWGGSRSPITDFAAGFGQPAPPSWNYPISYSGNGPCNCGIGIGPEADVPGLGHVTIAAALNHEVQEAPPETWAKYTWAWAQWVNQNLPILGLYDNAFHTIYQTNRYTDFPPQSKKWLWTEVTPGIPGQPVLWMQNGYLKLK